MNLPAVSLVLLFFYFAGLPAAFADTREVQFEHDSNDFINSAFETGTPGVETIWLTGDLREEVTDILGHEPGFLRLRYWREGQRSAWVVDEIGKTQPITFGIVVDENRIEQATVLAFRESRGWEIRHDFFTRQYIDVELDPDNRLSSRIDGISGATLSVQAMNKVVRMVLHLARQINA